LEYGEAPDPDMGFPPIADMGTTANNTANNTNAMPGDMGVGDDVGDRPRADAGPGSAQGNEPGCQCGTAAASDGARFVVIDDRGKRRLVGSVRDAAQ
jgi:hypothetical protein